MNKKGIKIFLAFLLAFALVIVPMQANFAVEDALVIESNGFEISNEAEITVPSETDDTEIENAEEVEVVEEPVDTTEEITEEAVDTTEETVEQEVSEDVADETSEDELVIDTTDDFEIVSTELEIEDGPEVEINPEGQEFKLTVVHTNDVHGNIFVSEDKVGYGRLKTYFDAIEGNKLLLDAGDASQGTLEVNLTKGAPTFELMNLVGYDAMTLGNHEYDFSKEQLNSNVSKANFQIYASNIVDESGNTPFLKGKVRDIDGVKVGIFGLATPETKYKANPLNTQGLKFSNPIEVAKEEVAKLKADGAEIIIALVHLGNEGSTKDNERSFTLIKEVAGLDLVIDGHDHQPSTREISSNLLEKHGTLYSQGIASGGGFGQVEITYNKETGEKSFDYKIVEAKDLADVTPDSQIEDYIAKLQEQIEPIKTEVIGHTDVLLDGERANVRTGQTNLGQLITKAMLEASGADAVITNGGGIRASIEAGDITRGDVYTVLPFGNTVTVIEVTGQQIHDALVFATDTYPEQKGAFPHVANLSFDIIPGEGIENLLLGGQPIDLNKTYHLATNDFMAVGGDGFDMFVGAKVVTILPGMAEIVMDYIEENMSGSTPDKDPSEPKSPEDNDPQPPSTDDDVIEGDVTKPVEDSTTKTPTSTTTTTTTTTPTSKSPKTGDVMTLLPVGALLVAGLGMVVVSKKKEVK